MILFEFFLERVIPKETHTKMSLKNICIVLSPCIMRAEVISIKDLVYSQKIILVTSIIFREFNIIFGNKKQREEAIRQTSKDYNKIYLEDRLGRYENNIGDESLKPASLTNSQSEVLEESRRSEDEGEDPMESYQRRLERKETLCKKISDVMKYDLEDKVEYEQEDK